ncbi:hypothetical protein J2S28_001594 [Rhizobium sp. SLBN-94]|nr:hypothetical protein [Rhizobium sp. SLBN-94]
MTGNNPMSFFSENVDAWGPLEWFDRLAKAVHARGRAVSEKDDLSFELYQNIASSSATRLVSDFEDKVRMALTTMLELEKANVAYVDANTELLSTLESLQAKNEGLLKRAATAEKKLRGANAAFERERKFHLQNQQLNRTLEARAEAAEAEVARLQAEIDRKSSMPGDHRYWEGRYRDEAVENEKLREALTPFVLAFESRRETYSKRYRSNRQLGYANFDKMPDDWAMEKVAFNMGTYRCARKALSSAGRDPLREFDALVEGPSFTEIASTGGEHHAE